MADANCSAAAAFFKKKIENDKNKLLSEQAGKMTPEIVRAICVANEGYETPELNDKLYLHFKAFTHIAGLDAYTGVHALWLESNAIEEIDNLSHMIKLSALFLHNNRITEIKNLHKLTNLRTLNLSNNCITEIGGLESLVNLQTLNLSKNNIATKEAVEPVLEYTCITNLDLGVNLLEDEAILDLFVKMPKIGTLVLKGNKVVSETRNYRRRMVNGIPQLVYLDDRPVFKDERVRAKAWQEGGAAAEKKAREKMRDDKRTEAREHRKRFRAWQQEQLALLQERRAAGLPEPEPCVSYETDPGIDDTPEQDDDHIQSNVYEFAGRDLFSDAKDITLTSNRKSFKERLAESRAAEAQKKFDNAVQKLKAKKAAAALAASAEKSTNEWTEETQMRLAVLVRSKKFDFEAVAKALGAEIKRPDLTADQCRLKWCSLDWEKYKKKCGLERPAAQKPPATNKADKIPVKAAVTVADLEVDAETALPPVPPVAAAAVTAEPELDFVEETDMDELD